MRAKRKIDDQVLLTMIDEGKEQKAIAEHFGVSPAAICQRLGRLRPPPAKPLKVDSLTPKERAFCLEIASGKSRTQAAFSAYDTGSRESAKSLGKTLMENSKIQEAVSELLEEVGLGRRERITKMKEFTEHIDPTIGLRATIETCKLGDDYPATKNLNLNLTADVSPVDLSRWLNKPQMTPPEGEGND